jgi:hypothetical protein
MMRFTPLVLAFASIAYAGPADAVPLILADCKAIGDAETCHFTRYLDGTHLAGEKLPVYQRMACRLQPNLLSRAPRMYTSVRLIADGRIAAVDLRYLAQNQKDYGRMYTTWERFAEREPYYHQRKEYQEPSSYDAYGRVVAGRRGFKSVAADHLVKGQMDELYKLTASECPIVTMDWFFAMTAVSADRGAEQGGKFVGGGFGYYDFIGVKNRDDFFKLAGVNLGEDRSEQSELLAVVLAHNSGVAQNDRMVVRRAATDGFVWYTMDFFDNNLDERNPLLLLDPKRGLKHQAERHFATLPNGLPAVMACTAAGELQVTAPDKIGPDTTARGKDMRIHCAKSCLSCHNNGFLKDINDEVRQIYRYEPKRGYNLLTSPDKEEELKLQAAYLRDFRGKLELDRLSYEQAVRQVVGYAPEDGRPIDKVIPRVSAEYRDCYQWYVVDPLSVEQVAAGIGCTVEEFAGRLKVYRAADQLTNHVLAQLSVDRSITRNSYEIVYPLLQQMVRGKP